MHTVILYYKYVEIADPKAFAEEHKTLCASLRLTGRVLIAHEGINGTLEGTDDAIDAYCAALTHDPRFADINIKRSAGTGNAFPKLMVKARDEIVSSHLPTDLADPLRRTAHHLPAEELHEWFENGKEFYIVDMRNDYETSAGQFMDPAAGKSLASHFGNFRDLPNILETLAHLKDKTIVTVCTGGVRCEKASGFLLEHGFSDVHQLMDGIVTYMEKYPNQHFKGKLYVFDQRVLMGFNTDAPEHEVIGSCRHCGAQSERFVNCANDDCHLHYICCERCETNGKPFCANECAAIVGQLMAA